MNQQPETQFDRSRMLLGSDALRTLSQSHVAVVGVGGVGSFIVEALARAGVGRLTLVDHDTVSISNLNRQLVALHSTLGQSKAAVMRQRILDINPDCQVEALELLYDVHTREALFSRRPDYIADAIDMVKCKLDLIETALSRGVPIVSSMGTGNRLDPTKFCITDISKTSGCPLARVMRKELRERGIRHHTVLASTELPRKPLPLAPLPPGKRAVPGSVSWTPPAAGMMIAGYIVRQLTGTE